MQSNTGHDPQSPWQLFICIVESCRCLPSVLGQTWETLAQNGFSTPQHHPTHCSEVKCLQWVLHMQVTKGRGNLTHCRILSGAICIGHIRTMGSTFQPSHQHSLFSQSQRNHLFTNTSDGFIHDKPASNLRYLPNRQRFTPPNHHHLVMASSSISLWIELPPQPRQKSLPNQTSQSLQNCLANLSNQYSNSLVSSSQNPAKLSNKPPWITHPVPATRIPPTWTTTISSTVWHENLCWSDPSQPHPRLHFLHPSKNGLKCLKPTIQTLPSCPGSNLPKLNRFFHPMISQKTWKTCVITSNICPPSKSSVVWTKVHLTTNQDPKDITSRPTTQLGWWYKDNDEGLYLCPLRWPKTWASSYTSDFTNAPHTMEIINNALKDLGCNSWLAANSAPSNQSRSMKKNKAHHRAKGRTWQNQYWFALHLISNINHQHPVIHFLYKLFNQRDSPNREDSKRTLFPTKVSLPWAPWLPHQRTQICEFAEKKIGFFPYPLQTIHAITGIL